MVADTSRGLGVCDETMMDEQGGIRALVGHGKWRAHYCCSESGSSVETADDPAGRPARGQIDWAIFAGLETDGRVHCNVWMSVKFWWSATAYIPIKVVGRRRSSHRGRACSLRQATQRHESSAGAPNRLVVSFSLCRPGYSMRMQSTRVFVAQTMLRAHGQKFRSTCDL
ncbi:hypothetical protein LX32DRAFT_162460 [Colletotrichum zoysiae]|uniref:Uncharacterized protein n=1 Tax=Colletotrichum zoysiae TaxID=1216348 RepID=A0AAD9H6J3_9PEZI|nr:hypothetical protein LX32DRAFT_162460 [Colletotrichum zoysiae]